MKFRRLEDIANVLSSRTHSSETTELFRFSQLDITIWGSDIPDSDSMLQVSADLLHRSPQCAGKKKERFSIGEHYVVWLMSKRVILPFYDYHTLYVS